MSVITTFIEKQQEKQILFERKILKELSLKQLSENVTPFFSPFFYSNRPFTHSVEDGCIDIAIEAYLLGGSMSRFGYYGEEEQRVRNRCSKEEKFLIDNLYEFLHYWGAARDNSIEMESLYIACEHFVYEWWRTGFDKGEKRYKLRLHH